MKDLAKMRLGVLKEIKQIKKFFDNMELGVKSRDPAKIYPAYIFLSNLVYHMNEGDLTPLSIELKQVLLNDDYMRNLHDE
jgi:hypothetical protein